VVSISIHYQHTIEKMFFIELIFSLIGSCRHGKLWQTIDPGDDINHADIPSPD